MTAFVTVLTSETRGAIAVVRIWGQDARTLADSVFRPIRGPRLSSSAPGALRFGRVGDGLGDEVVGSITLHQPPEVEIHCHGGTAAVALVVETLINHGGRMAGRDQFLHAHARSRIQGEALADLPKAATIRMADLLLDQADGALDREIESILRLVNANPSEARSRLAILSRRAEVGCRSIAGWTLALAGRPNVGKSRLLNAIAGFERSIVSPIEGTTRDIVTIRTAIEGYPVEIADMAGLRETAHPIEAEGVARARAAGGMADLVLLVLDRSVPLDEEARGLTGQYPDALVLANKVDLEPAWRPWNDSIVEVSAERGDGLDRLFQEIGRRLVREPLPERAAVPFRDRHRFGLLEAIALLDRGRLDEALDVLERILAG